MPGRATRRIGHLRVPILINQQATNTISGSFHLNGTSIVQVSHEVMDIAEMLDEPRTERENLERAIITRLLDPERRMKATFGSFRASTSCREGFMTGQFR